VAVDGAGNIYVADTANNTIRRLTASGVVTTLAGTAGVSGSTNGAGSAALFNSPRGLATDAAGNVYIADTFNYVIRKMTATGLVSTLAGTAGLPGPADGTGPAAQFIHPHGLATDSTGNVYVADTLNHTTRMIIPAGAVGLRTDRHADRGSGIATEPFGSHSRQGAQGTLRSAVDQHCRAAQAMAA
jgi:NHL repeat